jgi:uncharacterized hydrophobic protein (TIGR00341 family)
VALRLVELFIKEGQRKLVDDLLEADAVTGRWIEPLEDGRMLVRVLIDAEQSEGFLDSLEQRFTGEPDFRIVLLPVEASIPRPKPREKPEAETPQEKAEPPRIGRVSREELYQDIEGSAELTGTYLVLVALSSIVAAIGVVYNSVSVVIGAMVIAPLLGPNVALSLATTLGDVTLAGRAMKSGLAGIALGLALSILLGTVIPVNPAISEMQSRVHLELRDIVLALASGGAGALSFTTGISSALIGVMVAVSLLPPLVVLGLLIGSRHLRFAEGAALLFIANIVCVNLAGVVTFLIQGVRPRTWWEAEKARRFTRNAICFWILALAILALAIAYNSLWRRPMP